MWSLCDVQVPSGHQKRTVLRLSQDKGNSFIKGNCVCVSTTPVVPIFICKQVSTGFSSSFSSVSVLWRVCVCVWSDQCVLSHFSTEVSANETLHSRRSFSYSQWVCRLIADVTLRSVSHCQLQTKGWDSCWGRRLLGVFCTIGRLNMLNLLQVCWWRRALSLAVQFSEWVHEEIYS